MPGSPAGREQRPRPGSRQHRRAAPAPLPAAGPLTLLRGGGAPQQSPVVADEELSAPPPPRSAILGLPAGLRRAADRPGGGGAGGPGALHVGLGAPEEQPPGPLCRRGGRGGLGAASLPSHPAARPGSSGTGPARPGDGSRPFPPSLPLTEDLPPVLLAPHAAAQLTQPHAGFQLERGRLPEGAGALRHGGTGPPPPPPPPPTAGRSPRRHRRAGPMAGRQEGEARGGGRGRPRPSAASLLSLRYFGAGTARRCPPGVQRFGRRKNFAFRRAPSARCRPPAPSAAAGWPCRSSRVSAAGGRPLLRASGPWCEEPGRTKRNEVLKLGFANKPSFPVSGFGLAFLSTRPAGYAWVRAHPVLPKT